MQYYKITPREETWPYWFLRSPRAADGTKLDARDFTIGKRYAGDTTGWTVPVGEPGREIPFNFAAFMMIVASTEIGARLAELCGETLQRIPVQIIGSTQSYEILNNLDLVPDCIDFERCESISRYTEDSSRPDRLGEVRLIFGLRIKPEIAHGHHFFKFSEYHPPLIVSQDMKNILDSMGVNDVDYTPVT
jgi:hypothetical protein